ncbi:hypothetical protein [Methylobacterium platani]|uniref:hypothetical protein n=1 Tax=Methylobacterium platani TaxID=427683 RepID=UPI001AECE289|nr:hypothetical protein [Methylobacterium platani]
MNRIAHLSVASAGEGMGIARASVEVGVQRSAIHAGAHPRWRAMPLARRTS